MWWVHLQGTDPQTGEQKDEHNCAVNWLPMLAIETSGEVRGVHAAVNSHRNEHVDRMDAVLQLQQQQQRRNDLVHQG